MRRSPDTECDNFTWTSRLDLVRSTDTKPDTSYSVDERVRLLIVDLAADAPDIDVGDIGRGLEMQISYMLRQHCPRNDVALISSQIFENLKFPRQQINVPTGAAHGSLQKVELEITDLQHRFLDDRGAATGQGFHARQQFGVGKRLDEVVVSTSTQTPHLLVDLAERADDESGRGNAVFPQPLNDRNSVDSRKHTIDRHHDIFRCQSAPEPIIAVGRKINLIAIRHKRLYKLLSCFRIVFNDKNAAPTSCHDVVL
jgi:hypothetical protein